MPALFHVCPEVFGALTGADAFGIRNDGAEEVPAANVVGPGIVSGLARASVVDAPSAGVRVLLVIWFDVPAIPIVELESRALASGNEYPESEINVPVVLLMSGMSPWVVAVSGPIT